MLKNQKVRTKLLVVLVPLVAILVIGAGFEIVNRLDLSEDLSSDVDLVSLISAEAEFAAEVNAESMYAVAVTTGDERSFDAFSESADAANEAWGRLREEASTISGRDEGIDEALGRLNDDFASIVDLREEVAAGTANTAIVDTEYSQLAETLADVESATLTAANDATTLAALVLSERLAATQHALASVGRQVSVAAADDAKPRASVELVEEIGAFRALEARFFEAAPSAVADTYREALEAAADGELTVLEGSSPGAVSGGDPTRALEAIGDVLTIQASTQADILEEARIAVESLRDDASDSARNVLIGTLLALVLAGVAAVVVIRSISGRLQRLSESADDVARRELPQLVERLRSPDADTESLTTTPVPVDSADEIGRLAQSINAIQDVTVAVADEQSKLLRRGISDIFVNLARRNQTLLDRQIEFIDQLEASEESPDQLENLFKLDHLATRMRRNAESLLVLAGVDSQRRRGAAVTVSDVFRVAAGAVEDYARITFPSVEDALVKGGAAVDLAHLLSELMENATQFSSPDTTVEVTGRSLPDRRFEIEIADRGIGIPEEQLEEANALFREPPLMGLTMSRSLGFTVVARLAARLETDVALRPRADGGAVATVTLAAELIDRETVVGDQGDTPSIQRAVRTVPTRIADAGTQATSAETIDAGTVVEAAPHDAPPRPLRGPAVRTIVHATSPKDSPEADDTGSDDYVPAHAADTPSADGQSRSTGGPEHSIAAGDVYEPAHATTDHAPDQLSPTIDAADQGFVSLPSAESTFGTTRRDVGATAHPPDDRPVERPGFKDLATVARATASDDAPELPQRHRAETSTATDGGAPESPGSDLEGTRQDDSISGPITPTKRSPEEVRRLLSRYRSGLQKGRGGLSPEDGDE